MNRSPLLLLVLLLVALPVLGQVIEEEDLDDLQAAPGLGEPVNDGDLIGPMSAERMHGFSIALRAVSDCEIVKVDGSIAGEVGSRHADLAKALDRMATTRRRRVDRIMDGRPSELEAHIGATVRLAAESGVDVPASTALYASLLPMELAARAWKMDR